MYQNQKFITRVAVATLNQWAMDFDLNKKHIIESIQIAKAKVGPELEICGYSCEDHFLENDTVQHCWEVLYEILNSDLTEDIIVDLGMPVIHKNVFYNCRVICFDRQIMLIRPKMFLADDGNYRESRWFTAWQKEKVEQLQLPELIHSIRGQHTAPIGVAILKTLDTEIGLEICEELWVPQPTSTRQSLDGAEIIINSSGSYFQLRKMHIRTDLIKDITRRNGGAYLFSNLRGCDGNRFYFDGLSLIAINGTVFKISEIFSLKDVEVISCDLDLSQVRNHRINLKARSHQASKTDWFERIHINFQLTTIQFLEEELVPVPPEEPSFSEEQQMAYSISCYLWDYLRRSGANGYFLPLSGGADSAASASCVFHMCHRIYNTIAAKDNQSEITLAELRKIIHENDFVPKSAEEVMGKLFYTAYLGSPNSSEDSRLRASTLAQKLGNQHFEVEIDEIFKAFRSSIKVPKLNYIKSIFKQEAKFETHGGTFQEDLALQNIQARSRMVLSYLIAGLAPWNDGKQGFLLVLGSSNLDEGLRGYLTKYDCSSADLNPLGSLTKNDLKKLLIYTQQVYGIDVLGQILSAGASAELRPTDNSKQHVQHSEDEMGMSFDQLETFGKLRKVHRLGPFGMFRRLLSIWKHLHPTEIAKLVKRFFQYYAQNRHKAVTLTASFHAESHSNDDNRYDLRQFLYNWRWPFQFRRIDELLQTKSQANEKINESIE